ncbi:MAG: sigma 54-interacting transcriptional regulator [Lachnospiraceae bacterium]|nr:sigma 54-interacting transcriptional regulator [Lachnospiraceae bacterium]
MSSAEFTEQISYLDILNNLDVAVAVFDREGNYRFVNTALINQRNIPRADFLKMNVHDFLKVMDFSVFDLVMEQKQRVSRIQCYRDIQKVDSKTMQRITTGTPIFDENGEIKYVMTVMQDIDAFEQRFQSLLRENKVVNYSLPKRPKTEQTNIIAKSPQFLQLLEVANNVAPLDSTVLLYGESGCGKEVLADYIYCHSRRKDKPMITVNCAAIPENLIEAELFGYEKGAFTGASRDGKIGLVETADGGTLFLDEINSLSLNMQGKLLRTLEDKSIQRIGSTKTRTVDFRLIAATNRNLQDMVSDGTFREDLYYRLQVIPLTIPPVRERREDIVPLCLHFLHYFCIKYDLQKELSDSVLKELEAYDWPGNVREIRNFAERIVVMTPQATREINSISTGLLFSEQSAQRKSVPSPASEKPVRTSPPPARLDKEHILAALEQCQNHRQKAAELLGISRRQLQYKIKEFHISSRCRYEEK